MKYLVQRTYQYTTEEWVEADSEKEALDVPATTAEERIHDDTRVDSDVNDEREL